MINYYFLFNFREEILLFYDNNNAKDKEKCNLLMACEISHIWFGNIVGLSSWDYAWLNEGLGTYMAYKIIDMVNIIKYKNSYISPFLKSDFRNYDQTITAHLKY